MTPALQVEGARRVYAGRAAVDGASLTLAPGEVHCLLGPSGCGKSTLLRLIAGLERLDAGMIAAGGRVLSGPGAHVPPESRDVGFVFQDYALFPHLSVEANVGFGLRRAAVGERRARVAEQLERVGLADRAAAYPQTLSGGEQQRVALARALARRPALVLLDEPFSGLDSQLRSEVREVTLAALRAAGTAALLVTHDAEEALLMADALSVMTAGRVLQSGTPIDVYTRPVSLTAARLTGELTVLEGQAAGGRLETPFGGLATALLGPVRVMVRPEAIALGAEGREAVVTASRFAGHTTAVTLAAEGAHVTARVHPRHAPAIGERVRVALDERFCALFAPA